MSSTISSTSTCSRLRLSILRCSQLVHDSHPLEIRQSYHCMLCLFCLTLSLGVFPRAPTGSMSSTCWTWQMMPVLDRNKKEHLLYFWSLMNGSSALCTLSESSPFSRFLSKTREFVWETTGKILQVRKNYYICNVEWQHSAPTFWKRKRYAYSCWLKTWEIFKFTQENWHGGFHAIGVGCNYIPPFVY